MPTTINYRFVVRRGTAAAWTAGNPILLQGEFGLELDTLLVKMGDGTTAWNSLGYFYGSAAVMSKILDTAFSSTQGSILYRGATAWTALPPGTAGKFLKTNGGSANPVWDTAFIPPAPDYYYSQVIRSEPSLIFFVPCNEAGAGAPSDIVTSNAGTLVASAVGGSPGLATLGGFKLAYSNASTDGCYWPNPQPTGDFSVAGWFNTTTTLGAGSQFYSQGAILLSDIGGSANDWGLGIQGAGIPVWGIGNPDTTIIPSSGTWNDGLWHYAVGTFNHTTGAMKLYVDAVLVATGTGGASAKAGATTCWSGLNAHGFVGGVAALAMFSSVLTLQQITTHFACGHPVLGGSSGGGTLPITTKGDLVGFDTAANRLPVGADGQVLTADSTAPLGVSYQTPSGGGGGTATGAAWKLASNQSITTATQTVVDFDTHGTSIFDTQTYQGAGSGKLTVTDTGVYILTASILWDSNTTGTRELALIVNGVTGTRIAMVSSGSIGASESLATSAVLSLIAGDYVQMLVYQNSGGSINIVATEDTSYFAIAKLQASTGGGGGGTSIVSTTPDLMLWMETDAINLSSGARVPNLPQKVPWLLGPLGISVTAGLTRDSTLLNGLPTVAWPGSGYLQIPDLYLAKGCSIFVVMKCSTAAADQCIIGGTGANSMCLYAPASGQPHFRFVNSTISVLNTFTGTVANGVTVQANVTYDITTGAYIARQGRAADNSATVTTGVGVNPTRYLSGDTGVNPFYGSLAALIVYNRCLTPTEVVDIENYLFAKWNV